MSFSIRLGNFLYNRAFFLYNPLYSLFKKRQDRLEIELLEKIVKPGFVVVDVGANIGFYARILSQLTGPGGEVHCFEPDKENFKHLRSAVNKLENVVVNNKAVGPKSGKIKIYLSGELNVDHRTYEPEEYTGIAEIEAVSLDDYFEQGTRVDVIKMDIQGYEMAAVQGMNRVIKDNPEIVIVSEFWPHGLNKAGSSVTEYYNHLAEMRFKIYLLRGGKLTVLNRTELPELKDLGKEHFFNIIASRQSV
jgi:FkbM family methyltransferase